MFVTNDFVMTAVERYSLCFLMIQTEVHVTACVLQCLYTALIVHLSTLYICFAAFLSNNDAKLLAEGTASVANWKK